MAFSGQNNPSNAGNAQSQFGGFLGINPTGGSSIFGNTTSQPSTGLSTGTASGSTSGTTGLFGNTNATNTSSGSQTTGTSALFNLPKPAEQSSSQQPSTSSFFGQPNPTSGTSSPALPNLFGQNPPTIASTPTATSSSPAPGAGLFSGGGFFGKPSTSTSGTSPTATSTTPAPTSATATTAPAKDVPATSTGNLFGSFGTAPKPTETKSPVSGTSGGDFNLFGAAKIQEKKDELKSTSPFAATIAKEGDKSSAPKPEVSNPIAVAPPSMLRGKTIEEIVNKWSSELETHVKEFNKFAGEVAVWDRALIENSKNIAALHSHVSAAEREQNEINQSLDHIEQQQKDLSNTLDAYEKITQEILGGQGASLRALDTGPADTERDKNYMLATDLHTQLDDLSGSLSELIDSVNGLSLGDSTTGDDPLSQIAQILSGHLESLQWIDGAVREVENKVTDVESRIKESGLSHSLTNKSRGFGVSR